MILPISQRIPFKQVSCGSHHTVAVSATGEVYSCGLSSNGRLGLTPEEIGSPQILNVFELKKVNLPLGHVIDQAHCGNDFTLLLAQNGAILSAGSGRYGINCNFDEQNQIQDTAGKYDLHQFSKMPVALFGGYSITFVSAGEDHAAVLNENGELWTWGLNSHGQCGVNQSQSDIINIPVQPFDQSGQDHKQISFVACGGKHSLALAANN